MKLLLVTLLLTSSFYFISCNGINEKDKLFSSSDSTIVPKAASELKLVKTASINFKVKDVEASTQSISRLARKFNGTIYHQNFEAIEGGRNELNISSDSIMVITTYTPKANITVRVPSENLEDFMYETRAIGYFTGSNTYDIDDKSLLFLENRLKEKNREDVLILPENTKIKSLTKPRIIALKDEVTDREITNKAIDSDVAYSSVQLNLSQNALIKKEVIANYFVLDYQLPFYKRMGNALAEGWQHFLDLLIVLANCWPIVVLGIATMITYKLLLRKKVHSLNLKA